MAALGLSDAAAVSVVLSAPFWHPHSAPAQVVAFAALVVAVLAVSGYYHPRITLSVARDSRRLLATAAGTATVLSLLEGGRTSTWAAQVITLTGAMMGGRLGAYWLIRTWRGRGHGHERTLIVGAGEVAVRLADALQHHPEYGLHPVGFLDNVASAGMPFPVLGKVHDLAAVLAEQRVDRVVIAFGVTRESEMIDVLRHCEDASVDIHVLPRLFEMGFAVHNQNVDDVWGTPLLRLPRNSLRTYPSAAKRALDIAVAGVGLAILSPVYLALAAAVKLSSAGPIHFRQERVGMRGEVVFVLKFRTMRMSATSDTDWSPMDRATRVGQIMRRFSLDELPQLWNVLSGAMSLVGPRPERPYFVEQFKTAIPRYDHRHRVRVGLTGLAQINGLRGDTSIAERARFDNQYIENWSLWRDIMILAQTVVAVLKHAKRDR
jgi:exopolysaccharide biosynthesis polyprenyl glycosylphosphotransferase